MPPAAADQRSFLDPAIVARIGSLELIARTIVEGFLVGLHRSPFKGFSVEFSEFRPYVPGDDPATIDWKLAARRDRYYVKKFEEETNLECHLLLDVSASMAYGSQTVDKLQYGSFVLAALAYLMHRQRDGVALTLFDHQVVDAVPAGARSGHLRRLLARLSRAEAGTRSDVAMPLHRLAARMQRRGLVVLVSDLLDDPAGIIEGLKHLRFRGSDVLVFQVLDPAELTFPFEQAARVPGSGIGRRSAGGAGPGAPALPGADRRPRRTLSRGAPSRRHRLSPPAYGPSPGHGAARVSRGARGGGGKCRFLRRRSCSARWPSRFPSSSTSCGASACRACRSATCASCAARGSSRPVGSACASSCSSRFA